MSRTHRQGAAVALGLLCWTGALSAGEWRITPRFTLSETLTDNVTLADSGEAGDLITQVQPGLSVRGRGARLSSNIDYNLQHLFYADNTEFEQTNHQLQGNAQAELVEDWFYFDTRSTVSQQVIDNTGVISRDNRNRTSRRDRADSRLQRDNRSDVITREFSPSIRHTFADWLQAQLRYTHDAVDYTSDRETGQASNQSDEYHISLTSGRRFSRVPMSLTWTSRETDFDSGRQDQYDRLVGSVSYVVSRKLKLTATGGTEDNSSPLRGSRSGSGTLWSIGGTWKPSRRTSVSGSWGDRPFGQSFDVSASHRHRRWELKFDYDEEIRTVSQELRELVLVPLVDDLGDPIFDPITSSTILVPLDTPSVTDATFINRRMNSTLSYTGRRNRVRVRFFRNDREFARSEQDELQTGVLASVTRPLSPRLDSGLSILWRETETTGAQDRGSELIVVNPYLSYGIGPHLSTRLSYEFITQSGGFTGTDYTENALTARFDYHY